MTRGAHVHYLRHDDKLASLSVHSLHDPRHSAVADGQPPHQPRAVHHGNALVTDGEEDIGLGLRAALRGDLEQGEAAVPSQPPGLILGGEGADTPELSILAS